MDMMSADNSSKCSNGANMNVFEDNPKGKFGTFPQQTIFAPFKSKHFDAFR